MIPFILEVADKAAADYSIEVRYPFFDKRLVEFCLALPSDQKFSQGWIRIIHRRALDSIMPREIAWRFGKSCLGATLVVIAHQPTTIKLADQVAVMEKGRITWVGSPEAYESLSWSKADV